MKRLAKKFGEGVPVHLVFPSTVETDEEETVVDSPSSSSLEECRALGVIVVGGEHGRSDGVAVAKHVQILATIELGFRRPYMTCIHQKCGS